MAASGKKKAEDAGTQDTAQRPDEGPPDEGEAAADPAEGEPEEEEPGWDSEVAFGVVAIGASAGGLESMERLLSAMPSRTGLAFLLVQHLDPNHESVLPDLLARSTSMPVVQAAHNVPLEPEHVYVMPPNAMILVVGGRLTLEPRPTRGQSMPIDLLFRSLALDRRTRAVGVILSGTGTDGALGVKAIKAEGGITFAESETSAKHHMMPRSAIGTGSVDFVLTAEGIGKELGVLGPRLQVAYSQAELEAGLGGSRDLRKILGMLRGAKGVDFSNYRSTTIRRRIIRRMLLHKLHTVADYLKLLREQPGEIEALYQDVLIRVTGFFRDPAVHEALKESVFPALLRDRGQDQPVRIWVPGCATGEEAYSLAMGLVEFMGESKQTFPVQIFATDVSEAALERARIGDYVENIALDVSPDRLRRFFSKTGKSYQISKSIREMCIFARQDLTADPPFSRLDLVSCRNVLIYVEPALQRRVLNIFHYALKASGFLLLGHSETTNSAPELFRVVDRRHKIYARTQVNPRMSFDFPSAMQAAAPGRPPRPPAARLPEDSGLQAVQREADRVMMARYTPAGVIINEDMHVVQFRGQTGHYLEPAPGEPTFNLLKMARPPLAMEIRAAVHSAQKTGEQVRSGVITVRSNGTAHTIEVVVLPLQSSPGEGRPGGHHYLVLFEEQRPEPAGKAPAGKRRPAEPPLTATERRELSRLKQELALTREHMQSIIEEREAVNEELQSANEEILSSNEELQSINEELETAKEELQSTNEELTTVNEELRTRNLELTQLNNDLNNSLSSVNLPIVMLSTDLRIRRFTPMAERVLNLIPTDVGRPIGDIRPKIEVGDLEARISEVIDTMRTFEADVRDREGRWYSMRIRPYRTAENKIEGAVLTLVDVNESKRALEQLDGLNEYADALLSLVPAPLCVLDGNLRVRSVNEAFLRFFRLSAEATRGRFLQELGDGRWNLQGLRALLTQMPPGEIALHDQLVEHDFPDGRRKIRVNAARVPRDGRPVEFILLSFEDPVGAPAAS